MRAKDIIRDFCKPEDTMGSVIDTLVVLSEILEARENLSKENFDEALLKALFTLGFFPFYKVHGASLRPTFLQAINQTDKTPVEHFLSEALPIALTIALPNSQMEYGAIRKRVTEKFKA